MAHYASKETFSASEFRRPSLTEFFFVFTANLWKVKVAHTKNHCSRFLTTRTQKRNFFLLALFRNLQFAVGTE